MSKNLKMWLQNIKIDLTIYWHCLNINHNLCSCFIEGLKKLKSPVKADFPVPEPKRARKCTLRGKRKIFRKLSDYRSNVCAPLPENSIYLDIRSANNQILVKLGVSIGTVSGL